MTLQQLEYIIAVNRHRHFVSASKECGVTQPTLSQMIQKLEQELGVTIFDRTKQPVQPTPIGIKLIEQAEKTLCEMRKMNEMVTAETEVISGPLKVGVIPTLAPYLVPSLIQQFKSNFKEIELTITEMPTESLINALHKEHVDMFIAATPLEEDDFYEIPLYFEKFVAYFAPSNKMKDIQILSASNMPSDNIWILSEGHCLRDQIFNFCKTSISYNQIFEAGSIDTLIKVVDKNGGYSVIPELHIDFLSDKQKENIREINNPPAVREISVVIQKDFIKERMINAVADSVKAIIPEHMLDERLKKFSIRLI